MLRRLETPLILTIAGAIVFWIGYSLLAVATGIMRGVSAFVMMSGPALWLFALWVVVPSKEWKGKPHEEPVVRNRRNGL